MYSKIGIAVLGLALVAVPCAAKGGRGGSGARKAVRSITRAVTKATRPSSYRNSGTRYSTRQRYYHVPELPPSVAQPTGYAGYAQYPTYPAYQSYQAYPAFPSRSAKPQKPGAPLPPAHNMGHGVAYPRR